MKTWKTNNATFEFTKDLPIQSSAWSGHYFFGYDLVANTRPSILVELGTHKGNSFFSFAQAVKDLNLETELHCIDTWKGDEQAGFYGEEVFKEFQRIADKYYTNVNIIKHRMLFDDAVKEFKDNSIDILHIDGLHTYEAVKHDFETWLPKVKQKSGIILLHDVLEKKDDFGVYKLWEEITAEYPNTITFEHYHGLGVLLLNKKQIINKENTLFTTFTNYYKALSEVQILQNKCSNLSKSLKKQKQEIQELEIISNNENSQQLNKMEENLKRLHKLNAKIRKLNSTIIAQQNEIVRLTQLTTEYSAFQQTNIWKILKLWEKFKKYFKNFFINIRRDGFKLTFKRILTRINNFIKYKQNQKYEKNRYKYWIQNHKITKAKRNEISKEIKNLSYQPLISIIMPVYNVDVKYLKEAVKSVKKQIYTNWELCIADDASTNKNLRNYLPKLSKQEKIKVTFRSKNGHISECSNSALKLAKGEFIVLLDDDDIIYPHALAEIVKLLNKKRKTDLIYSDEDKLEMNGKRTEPFFKPDWSPDLFLSINYLCHLVVIRKTLVDDVGWFRKGYEGSQDYDLLLRVTEKTKNIEHIADVLYSWRRIPGSTAAVYDNKGYADRNALKSLRDAVKRRNLDAVVTKGLFPGSFRVKYNIKNNPMVSIIIPTKDKVHYLQRCVLSILEKTTYDNYEIIIVDTGSKEKDTFDFYEILKTSPRIRFLHWKKDFNYSLVNNFGVKNAKGEFVLLLNNDTEVITSNWIENMLEHAQRKEIGAVGVKLLYPNDTIQHAGVILGINGGEGRGVAGHAFKYFPAEVQGFPALKDVIRNYSAVTAACLMIRKDKFNSVKGLNKEFRIAFNDVDFCLKLYKEGFNNLYTPYAELYHHESISVGTPEKGTRDIKEFGKEIDLMWERWRKEITNDSFYNKNLSLSSEDFSIKVK